MELALKAPGDFAPANDNPVLVRRALFASMVAPSVESIETRAGIARRQFAGSIKSVPANDNQSWPLLAQLRKDGNDVLVPVAERYRQTYDRATMNGLQGVDAESNIFNVVQRPAVKSDPDNRTKGPLRLAHTAGQSAGGRVARPASEDRRKDDDKPNPTRPGVAKSYSRRGDDMAVSVIDAKRDLLRLRKVLGPLVEPFEEAVVDGDTLTEIGRRRDAGQSAPGAGKLVVMIGLQAVQEEFGRMDREQRRAA